MHEIFKPRKRLMLYWFFNKGYFFITLCFLLLGFYFYHFTELFLTARTIIMMTPIIGLIGLLLVFYEWRQKEYYLMKNYLFLKDSSETRRIKYSQIKKLYPTASILQTLLGTTNLCVDTGKEKNYIHGIRDFKKIESKLIHKMHEES